MRVKWAGDATWDRLQAKLIGNVDNAGALYQERIEQAIDTPGPPRSSPGEAPHVDSGELEASWYHETDSVDAIIVSRVGSTSPHAVYMEEGTDTVAPRPFVVPTLVDNADELARTICKQ